MRVGAVAAPAGFADLVGPLPPGAVWKRSVRAPVDLVVLFVTSRAVLTATWARVTSAVGETGVVWVAWPKKSSGVATDITENTLREDLLPSGWVDVKVCAIDATWSGLKFVLRVARRTASSSNL
jgi:hypothetical protein